MAGKVSEMSKPNRYSQIIEKIFLDHYSPNVDEIVFERDELVSVAVRLGIELPKNLGDLIYTFRYRGALPITITDKAPPGMSWVIRPKGRSRYCFSLSSQAEILPNPALQEIKIPDATPGIIERYRLGDEQSLLAKLRYNRLIDIFTGITCYSLQNHLRTSIKGIGQVETDELYVGVDKHGAHYVFPVQAKGGKDRINVVQIEQDMALCAEKFPELICRPIAAQFMQQELIALFELTGASGQVVIVSERHFRLVLSDDVSNDDLRQYRSTGSV